jgi:hypothetical protein
MGADTVLFKTILTCSFAVDSTAVTHIQPPKYSRKRHVTGVTGLRRQIELAAHAAASIPGLSFQHMKSPSSLSPLKLKPSPHCHWASLQCIWVSSTWHTLQHYLGIPATTVFAECHISLFQPLFQPSDVLEYSGDFQGYALGLPRVYIPLAITIRMSLVRAELSVVGMVGSRLKGNSRLSCESLPNLSCSIHLTQLPKTILCGTIPKAMTTPFKSYQVLKQLIRVRVNTLLFY